MNKKFTKLEIVLISFLLLAIAGLFIFYSKSLHTEKLPETAGGWGDRFGVKIFGYCQRKEAYKLAPEFERSLSLIFQRLHEKKIEKVKQLGGGTAEGEVLWVANGAQKCLDIEYANSLEEMGNADGLFLFSKDASGPDKLKIIVSPDYKVQDDLMTALLLAHEISHAEQFVMEDVFNTEISKCYQNVDRNLCDEVKEKYDYRLSCIDKETQAFYNSFRFFTVLNNSEMSSIATRYLAGKQGQLLSKENLPVLNMMENYNDLMFSCVKETDSWGCVNNTIKLQVQANPFYQKQCKSN